MILNECEIKIIKELEIDERDFPRMLFDLKEIMADKSNEKELVISFPDGDISTVLVEIYNAYRE